MQPCIIGGIQYRVQIYFTVCVCFLPVRRPPVCVAAAAAAAAGEAAGSAAMPAE